MAADARIEDAASIWPKRLGMVLYFAFGAVSVYGSRLTIVVLLGAALLLAFTPGVASAMLRVRLPLRACLALALLALTSSAWAHDPAQAIDDAWRIAFLCMSVWLLVGGLSIQPPLWTARMLDAACLGFALMLLLLLLEWVTGGALGSIVKQRDTSDLLFTSHACALASVSLWPLCVHVWRRTRLGVATALAALAALTIGLLPLLAASIALAAGALVFMFAQRSPRWAGRSVCLALALGLLATPWLALHGAALGVKARDVEMPSSWVHRLVIWQFVAERALERPLVGHGIGTAHGLGADSEARAHYESIARPVGGDRMAAQPPLHPHNGAVQLWHDLGLLGVGLALLLLFGVSRAATHLPRPIYGAVVASLVAWAVLSGLSFGLWQKWWIAGAGWTAGLIVLSSRSLQSQALDRKTHPHA